MLYFHKIDNPMMDVNGVTVEVDPGRSTAPHFAENSRTFLPLWFAAENLNCWVTWKNATKEILIVFYGVPNADVG